MDYDFKLLYTLESWFWQLHVRRGRGGGGEGEGRKKGRSDNPTKGQLMDRLGSHLPLMSLDCVFELLYSGVIVLPGKWVSL